jgi:hypothetical protein
MYNRIGKFTNYMPDAKAEGLSEIKADVLWYLLHLTQVDRFFTHYSLNEFLVRYLLITEYNLEKNAQEFIENEILISGYIAEAYFEFTLQDLIDCIGFSASDSKFNVANSRAEFIEKYKFIAPNVKIIPNDNPSKPIEITKDALVFAFMGLKTLLEIDSLSIKFKDEIKQATSEEIQQIEKYVAYVMSLLQKSIFIEEQPDYQGKLNWMEEFYDSSKEVHFNVKQNLSTETIAKIYGIAFSPDMEKYYSDFLEDEEYDEVYENSLVEFAHLYEHIKFAYGVKHGYITISNDPYVEHDVDPYFKIDFELFMDDDCNCFSSETIFYNWSMDKWIDLLP